MIHKEKRGFKKEINQIEMRYIGEMERFKPESIESLKFIEVNRKKMLDVRKHVLKRKR